MTSAILNDGYELRFYSCDQGLHLMVWKDKEELRCRKGRKVTVQKLADGTVKSLGRSGLQFRRTGSAEIQVLVKNSLVGTITPSVLENALALLEAGKLARYEK